ncbi:MAG: hypothetical protein BECKG1743D_GA0114223_106572 [Candidatus Kentron sp. G]|nr:MAG: hypothetical protein BECKG1743F_GA0114225_106951 [Candidatus Kentron sp. G]VFN04613.1 MAG: hypothetical protein BECKG1743E_GA0114224_107531 [Candidatus Kentron sp. G]VFN04988.1 MAG: hypothetical protein BECKG1743D_GA0114223_106572 [Candidatus Kentron sp. G]
MRLLLRLESEQNDRAIRYILFRQSPYESVKGRIFYLGEGQIAVRLFVFLACRFTTEDVAQPSRNQ